jgi:hypothetical protein
MTPFCLRLRILDRCCANCAHAMREHSSGGECGIFDCPCLAAQLLLVDPVTASLLAREQFARSRRRKVGVCGGRP